MDNFLNNTKKKNHGLIKLRKGKLKLFVKKPKENNPDISSNLYEEYLLKKRIGLAGGYTKKSMDILSSNQLNIYNEFNNDNNKEIEKKYPIENTKKNEQNKNISKTGLISVNSTKLKKEKEDKNENPLFFNNDNYNINKNNDISKNAFENEDINKNKSNLNIIYNNNKENNKDKNIKTFKRKKTKYNIILKEDEYVYEEKNEKEYENKEYNIKIFYEGKGLSIKISKEENFATLYSELQKILFPFYKINDYDILYKLKILDPTTLNDIKLSNIIDDINDSPTFYLRKKYNNDKNNKDTTVTIENFPSFTDLATELNKFFEKEKRESNFTVDYKGSLCKVSFSDSEKAFSLIIYLTKLKKKNPIYKRLKINMNYKLNAVVDVKQLKQKPLKLILPLINKNSSNTINITKDDYNKKLVKINTEKNIYKYRNNDIINTNCNTVKNKNKRRYDSYLNFGEKKVINSESKIIKNKIKNYDSSLENYKQILLDTNSNSNSNNNILKNRNSAEIYTLESKQNNSNSNDNLNLSQISEKIKRKQSKLKSTNCIIDLSKVKKRNTLKNFVYNNTEDKTLSPQMNPNKRANYYNIFVNDLSKKYKDNELLKSKKKQRFSFLSKINPI